MRGVKRAVRCGATIGILAVLLATAGARAEPPAGADREKLATLLRAAAEATKKEDYGACIDALTSAREIEDSPERQGDLGVCEEGAGRDTDAYRDLAAALNSPGADHKKEPLSRFVDPFARVSMRIVHVYIDVEPPQASV